MFVWIHASVRIKIKRWLVFLRFRPICDKIEPRFSIWLCSLVLGGFESTNLVVVYKDTFCKPSAIFLIGVIAIRDKFTTS